ncbi:MAG TPA: hypothetical protein PLM07_17855 [Candidatus Rifleibacterium sp.]|nr:hypothetical protein [Candidatus Rifleibacterium sp.]
MLYKRLAVAMLVVAALNAAPIGAVEQSQQRILLNDKTVLIGRVVEMKDGIYSIETETLGIIKVSAEKVAEISALGASHQATPEIGIIDGSRQRDDAGKASQNSRPAMVPKVSGSSDLSQQQEEVSSRVQSMTMDGEFLDSMMNLGNSDAMNDVMQDPEIMDAISRNDYEYLMNSEKMKNLMDSQEIKEMLGDVQP